MHELWVMAGKPSSGEIFECKKNAKYKYKLAVRDAAEQFGGKLDDELLHNFFEKDFNNFWKTWKRKSGGSKCLNIQQVAGLRDKQSIADKFAEHFSDVSTYNALDFGSPAVVTNSNVSQDWHFSIEEIDCAIRALVPGKTAGW